LFGKKNDQIIKVREKQSAAEKIILASLISRTAIIDRLKYQGNSWELSGKYLGIRK